MPHAVLALHNSVPSWKAELHLKARLPIDNSRHHSAKGHLCLTSEQLHLVLDWLAHHMIHTVGLKADTGMQQIAKMLPHLVLPREDILYRTLVPEGQVLVFGHILFIGFLFFIINLCNKKSKTPIK